MLNDKFDSLVVSPLHQSPDDGFVEVFLLFERRIPVLARMLLVALRYLSRSVLFSMGNAPEMNNVTRLVPMLLTEVLIVPTP